VFIPGLVRTDVAFIDRCVATVRDWRSYVSSTRRMAAMQAEHAGGSAPEPAMPLALQWWCQNYGLIRDLAIRGYPVHVVSYDGFLRAPKRVAAEVVEWIGRGDPDRAAAVVRPELRTGFEAGSCTDEELAEGIEPRHVRVFDDLYATIDAEQPLSPGFVETLNRTDEALRPAVLRHQASAGAETIADILGRQ
jgi:hypothetical protein